MKFVDILNVEITKMIQIFIYSVSSINVVNKILNLKDTTTVSWLSFLWTRATQLVFMWCGRNIFFEIVTIFLNKNIFYSCGCLNLRI